MFYQLAIGQRGILEHNYDVEWINLNHTSPHGTMYSQILIDSLGYRWICGNGGLHVFDGSETITYFGKDKKYQLLPDSIKYDFFSMVMDKYGMLWLNIRHTNTILKFDPTRRKILKIITSPSSNQTNSNVLRINERNELIFMVYDYDSESYKIYRYDKNGITALLYEHNYLQNGKKNRIRRLYTFKDKLFLLSSDKIIMLNSQGSLEYSWPITTKSKTINDLLCSDDKIVIISNNFQRIETLHLPSQTWIKVPGSPNEERTNYSYASIFDNILIGGSFNQLFIDSLENNKSLDLSEEFVHRRNADTPYSLTSEIIQIINSPDGSYLILTTDQLYRLKKRMPTIDQFLLPMPSSDSRPSMRQITKYKDESIVASYYGGLAIQESKESPFQPYVFANKSYDEIKGHYKEAYSLSTWNDMIIWNNTMIGNNGELSILDEHEEIKHTTSVVLNDTLYSHTWYNSESKILRYDLRAKKKEFIKVSSSQKDSSWTNFMLTNKMIADTSSNLIWIATSKKGILCIDTEMNLKKHYSPAQLKCFKNKYVYDLDIKDGVLWYTSNDGLGSLDLSSDEIQMYHLPFVNEYQILDNKTLWSLSRRDDSSFYIGTDIGLYYFDINSKTFFSLEDDHPMSRLEYNRHSTMRDGEDLYFGTTSGLFKCKEDELKWKQTDKNLGPIILQSIILNKGTPKQKSYNQDVTSMNMIELSPRDNTVDIDFSIMNDRDDIFYSYRILELDTNWTNYAIDNSINIFALPIGKNTLEIKASYQMDNRYSIIKRIVLNRAQYWYKTWWAFALYGSFISTLIWLIHRNRVNQIIKYQNLRTKISSDLHDDVGSIMSGISLQAEMMSYTSKGENKNLLTELSSMSKDAMEKMRDIVWALDSRKDNIEDLTLRMQEYSNTHLDKKGITSTFEIDTVMGSKSLNPEQRQNIYLIYKEAISNILKHSNATLVVTKMIKKSHSIELVISDNGHSNSIKPSSGQGLDNMRLRANRIGGKIYIENSKHGFVIRLVV